MVYGSFIGAMLGLGLFWWRYRVPLLATADLIAPSMLLGLALGRVGCMLNGCCFGGPCDLPWKVTFPWNSPVQQSLTKEGITGVYGLKFRDGPNHCAVIEALDADSPAARQGLKPGMEIDTINDSRPRAVDHATSVSCSCLHGSENPTAAELAASAVLRIDKLAITFRRASGEELEPWIVDDPPEAQVGGTSVVKIYGLEIASGDDGPLVSRVRTGWPLRSPETAAGIQVGDIVESVSGCRVAHSRRTSWLLDEHRRRAWVLFGVAGRKEPIRVDVDRPLPRSLPVHPTQLYSTIDALILCFLLLAFDPFRRRDGAVIAGADDDRRTDYAVPHRGHSHRREGDLGHAVYCLAEHQPRVFGRRDWLVDLYLAASAEAGVCSSGLITQFGFGLTFQHTGRYNNTASQFLFG